MSIYTYHLLILGFIYVFTYAYGESSTCLTVYNEGGAAAVFQSPKCPRWKLSDYTSRSHSRSRSPTMTCQSAVHKGRRKYQEDRTFCSLDIHIPFPGPTGITDVAVGIVAVFDGHNGVEASEMASKLLLEYFTLHTYFLLDTTFSILSKRPMRRLPNKRDQNSETLRWDEEVDTLEIGRFKLTLSAILDGTFHLEILKESLLRAIHDIDASFSKEASRKNLDSGSTATVILVADGQILVANIGDSKAFVCSEIVQSPSEAKATLLRLYRQKRREGGAVSRIKDGGLNLEGSSGFSHFNAKELTRDHHPDRDDEKIRVEAAGGRVLQWGGVHRINGQLAVSRAIGDVSFKSYGVISIPEVTDWQSLTANDSYLIAASDGVFEKLSPQDVCDLLWEIHSYGTGRSQLSSSCPYSLADCIVNTAYDKGSMDNLAAVVIPLRSGGSYEQSGRNKPSGLIELEHAHPVLGNFDRLLVRGTHSSFECFYLSENLNENDDYTFWVQNDENEDLYDSTPALPNSVDHGCSGPLNVYTDHNMCMLFGMTTDGIKDQCINPEGFASFLGLLQSIPVHNIGSDDETYGHTTPDSRYRLKKRFDRGSYGEVWLAFHWTCSNGNEASNWSSKNNYSFNTFRLETTAGRSKRGPSSQDCKSGPAEDNMFILKRIMVERGATVYLSGLREKHFGEIFLNASTNLGGSLSKGLSDSFTKASPADINNHVWRNKSIEEETESTWNSKTAFPRKRKLLRATYEEGLNHIARYVESFESRSNEIWLVFRHEGVSLSKLLYTAEEIEEGSNHDEVKDEPLKHLRVLRPSKWWHWLKTTKEGQAEMSDLIWQLLIALKSCHDRNITHRDIKPENMVICFEDPDTGRCLNRTPSGDKNYTTRMRIIDFGSAMDEFTVKHLYGFAGPSRAEQTYEYTPPEAYLNASWYQGPTQTTLKYDMWSVGVLILELIIGSPNVFQISAITRALLDQHLDGWNESLKELAYKLRSFMEMCILIPGSSSKHRRAWGPEDRGEASPASWKCSEEFFSSLIKSRDPLKIGFPDVWALRLVRQLLRWDPEDRPSVDDALRHPYFYQRSKREG